MPLLLTAVSDFSASLEVPMALLRPHEVMKRGVAFRLGVSTLTVPIPVTPPWIPGVPGKTIYIDAWGGAAVVVARPRAGFKPAPTRVGEGGGGHVVGRYCHSSDKLGFEMTVPRHFLFVRGTRRYLLLIGGIHCGFRFIGWPGFGW